MYAKPTQLERKAFLNEIVLIASENSIDYWTNKIRRYYNDNNPYMEIFYFDPSDNPINDTIKSIVNNRLVSFGLKKIMKGNYAIRDDILKEILIANVRNDSGYIDSECADVIVQIALFDQIVFG